MIKRILITGAGGFIGGSLVESIYLSNLAKVRAGIKRWSSAARIGRFPVEIVLCNIMDEQQIAQAVEGVTHVIHCAVGSQETTVQGTNLMLNAAFNMGVERFVHVSTVDVYGKTEGVIDETSPYQFTGNSYGDSKIEAEKLCWQYFDKGLPVTVIRPSVVYGPYSKLWTVKVAEKIRSGRWGILKGYGEGLCNLVYIDDLVSGILLAATHEKAIGEAFNINGPEAITWNEYFILLNAAMGLPGLKEISLVASKRGSLLMEPIRKSARYLLDNHNDMIMKIYGRYVLANLMIKKAEKTIKTTPTSDELNLYSRRSLYLSSKARDILGYSPQYDVEKGINMSIQWLTHHSQLI